MPKISVIMGIYNCASTLQEALNSLYAQTYQNFEIILCDDGSVDNTYEIALENQRKHSNIVLLKNAQNEGLNKTLNKCLAVAQGEYIARMDGDDLSLPNRFEKEIQFLEAHTDFAIVSSPMEYFDENGTYRVGQGKGEVRKKDFIKGSPICHAPCMVRHEAYIKVGGYSEDPKYLRVEDYNLWFKMYAAGYKAFILPEPYYKMRDDSNATSRRKWWGYVNEYRVMKTGFKMIRLPIWYQFYALRPLIIGMLPKWLYNYLHKRK